ncbi:hypothetical protein [Burkholderia pseudomallei]|uniref:hypothetical protein n=1 Tax=Burkholderia pseudomallei TaxID=28450 RepID=UPI0021F734E6|nr:hypothetical protein [Burkholderia pseudomallei]MCW0104966.1 hypothetical protein [Burkholderia pseudomallei]
MTTTHSRADALTDDERIVLKTLANWRGLGNRERSALMKILAAPPVEQPEFTDECADCGCLHPGEYWVHPRVWSGSGMAVDGGKLCLVCLEARLQRRLTVADFPADAAINRCVLWDLSEQPAAAPIYPQGVMDIPPYSPSGSGQSQATSALTWNAPAPADERAAFVERVMGMFEAWPNGKPGPTDEPESHYRFGYNTALEDVLTALDVGSPTRRAASANETGAEGPAIELLRKFMEYRDSDYVPNVLFDCARTIIDNAMAAAAPADEHSTIECQAHSGPDCIECNGTGAWSGSADERAVSFEAWCDRFPEISAVERLRDAWQEARAAASPAAEAVTITDAEAEMLVGIKKFHTHDFGRGPELHADAITDAYKRGRAAAPQPAQADAPVRIEALRKGLFNARDALRTIYEHGVTRNTPIWQWIEDANCVLNGEQADAPAEAREPIAWVTDDDRAITAAQKQRALADGGATASSVRPYSIPCYAVSAPADAGEARLTDAARDMLAERRQQVEAEGWTPEHDDQYQHGAIALAAACYAANAGGVAWADPLPSFWPWMHNWWKPTTPRRDLVKAGALILAELERLDRAALLNGADHDQ